VTEGGVDEAGVFHRLPGIDDARLEGLFAREVLAFLVDLGLLSPEWAERILSWPHSGFNSVSFRKTLIVGFPTETEMSPGTSRTRGFIFILAIFVQRAVDLPSSVTWR
jgi:hypothetical protein